MHLVTYIISTTGYLRVWGHQAIVLLFFCMNIKSQMTMYVHTRDCRLQLYFDILFGVMHNFAFIYFQDSYLSMQGLLFLRLHLNGIHIPTDA